MDLHMDPISIHNIPEIHNTITWTEIMVKSVLVNMGSQNMATDWMIAVLIANRSGVIFKHPC